MVYSCIGVDATFIIYNSLRTVYKIGLGKDCLLKLTIFLHRLHIQILTSLEYIYMTKISLCCLFTCQILF